MSEARKCDRCNEFYELSKEDKSRRDWPADTKGAVARLFLRSSTDDRDNWYDLCPKCVESLQEWLENHGPLYKFLDKTESCPLSHCKGCNRLTWCNNPTITKDGERYYECHKYNTKVDFFSKPLNDLVPEDFKKELLTGPPIYKGAVDFAESMSDPYEDGGL